MVVSIGSIHAGTKAIIIPEVLELKGSIRCLHHDNTVIRERIKKRIRSGRMQAPLWQRIPENTYTEYQILRYTAKGHKVIYERCGVHDPETIVAGSSVC